MSTPRKEDHRACPLCGAMSTHADGNRAKAKGQWIETTTVLGKAEYLMGPWELFFECRRCGFEWPEGYPQ